MRRLSTVVDIQTVEEILLLLRKEHFVVATPQGTFTLAPNAEKEILNSAQTIIGPLRTRNNVPRCAQATVDWSYLYSIRSCWSKSLSQTQIVPKSFP